MDDLLRGALRTIRRHGMLRDGDGVVVAFSGGPDSVALALVLSELSAAGELPLRVRLAYLNHGLRGEESEREERFCRAFAEDEGLELHAETAPDLRAMSGSLEANARRVRYGFLRRVAEGAGATAVATGHHADDVAESVLLRIIRGAGVRGLAALRPVRPLAPDSAVRVVRPLLDATKEDVLAFLDARGRDFCRDRTNESLDFTRNRIRHDLLPRMAADFPQFSVGSLCALNTAACEAADLIDAATKDAWEQVARRESAGWWLAEGPQADLPAAVRKGILQRAVDRAGSNAGGLRAEHLNDLAALVDERVGVALTLPGGAVARREHGGIYVTAGPGPAPIVERELGSAGFVDIEEQNLRVAAHIVDSADVNLSEIRRESTGFEAFLDLETVPMPLAVRGRRPGDRFHPLGAPGGRPLKDFFVDAQVPFHQRDTTALVVTSDGRIAWVVGHRIGEAFKVTEATTRVLCLRATALT